MEWQKHGIFASPMEYQDYCKLADAGYFFIQIVDWIVQLRKIRSSEARYWENQHGQAAS